MPACKKIPIPIEFFDGGGKTLIAPRMEKILSGDSQQTNILDFYRWFNSEEYRKEDSNLYLDLNSVTDNEYAHSRYFAKWYERNYLQQLAMKYQKIIVLFGAGHFTILKDLIVASDQMQFVDGNEYL